MRSNSKPRATKPWKQQTSFASTADRLKYARACVASYVNRLDGPSGVRSKRQYPLQGFNVRSDKSFFFTRAEMSSMKSLTCVTCHKRLPTNRLKWIINSDALVSYTPMCHACFVKPIP